jgi:hypothetical protein
MNVEGFRPSVATAPAETTPTIVQKWTRLIRSPLEAGSK